METGFRWNEWNYWKLISRRGIEPEDAEYVVRHAWPPYPEPAGGGKYTVWGQTLGSRYVQVMYILDEDGTVFIIHARPLEESEKRRYRRK